MVCLSLELVVRTEHVSVLSAGVCSVYRMNSCLVPSTCGQARPRLVDSLFFFSLYFRHNMLARCTAALAVTPVAAAALRQPAAARAMTTGGFETGDRGMREDKKRGGAEMSGRSRPPPPCACANRSHLQWYFGIVLSVGCKGADLATLTMSSAADLLQRVWTFPLASPGASALAWPRFLPQAPPRKKNPPLSLPPSQPCLSQSRRGRKVVIHLLKGRLVAWRRGCLRRAGRPASPPPVAGPGGGGGGAGGGRGKGALKNAKHFGGGSRKALHTLLSFCLSAAPRARGRIFPPPGCVCTREPSHQWTATTRLSQRMRCVEEPKKMHARRK